VIHDADSHAAAAQAANTAAYGQLSGQLCDVDYGGVTELNGLSLEPGVYCASAFILSGTLTLTGSGVWIFKSASTLTLMQGASVIGGDPCNIWWRVGSSATLGVNSSLYGDVLAYNSIALQTGATLNGRALAQIGAVTLDDNTITYPICQQLPTSTPTSAATATATATATVTATATANVPTPTGTYIPPTATAEVPTATNMPVMTALPPTGGAPLQSESSPWGLLIIGGFSALALVLGSRAYRKTSKRSQ
jgi:type VI secretion system secreted protein VgrG